MRNLQRFKEVGTMKRKFEEPSIELVNVNVEDVITTSPGGIDLGEDELPITPFDKLFGYRN